MRMINKEGGAVYTLTPKEEINELFTMGLLHGTFYATAEDIKSRAGDTLEMALRDYPLYATEKAIEGATIHGLKTIPLLWLLHLSTLEDKTLFKETFPHIIKNPTLLHTFIQTARKGDIREGLGRVIKNATNEWLMKNLNDYWTCRYRTKLKEVTNVTRPKSNIGTKEFQAYMDYIQNGKLSFDRIRKLKEVLSDMEKDDVTDITLRKIEEEQFQIEELKSQIGRVGDNALKNLYISIFKTLSYPALIQNLSSAEEHIKGNREIIERIGDITLYNKSKMLPFSLIAAHFLVQSEDMKKALEKVLLSISDTQIFTPTFLLVDSSSSMSYSKLTKSLSALDIAAVYASLLQHQSGSVRLFSISERRTEIEKGEDIFETAGKITGAMLGLGTELGQIMEEKPEGDVVVFTDSEVGEDLEEIWVREGKGRLIVWQMVNSNIKISNHPSVIYLHGYNEDSWRKLNAILMGGNR